MNPKELNCCLSVMISNMKRSRASDYKWHWEVNKAGSRASWCWNRSMTEFSACKIKHFKFTEEIKLFLIYPTFTITSLQFLWTSAEAMPPTAPSSRGTPSSNIRPVMKIKMHNDFGDRETRPDIVSYSKHQSFLKNHSTFLKTPSTKFRSKRCRDSDACLFSCNLSWLC